MYCVYRCYRSKVPSKMHTVIKPASAWSQTFTFATGDQSLPCAFQPVLLRRPLEACVPPADLYHIEESTYVIKITVHHEHKDITE